MSLIGLILVIFLVLILFGGIGGPYVSPNLQYGYGFGHGGIGIVGVILIIVLILVLTGRF